MYYRLRGLLLQRCAARLTRNRYQFLHKLNLLRNQSFQPNLSLRYGLVQ